MQSMQRRFDFSQGSSFHPFSSIGRIVAALSVGLSYVIAFPIIGLALLVWIPLRSVTVNTLRALAMGSVTVAAGFFLSVIVTVYGGFPVWFV